MDNFLTVLTIIKEIVTIISIAVGVWIALPLIRKKLASEQVKNTIDEITKINEKTRPLLQKMIEKYSFVEDSHRPITLGELQSMYLDCKKIKDELVLAQGEVATLAITLENYIRRLLHWYKRTRGELIFFDEIQSIIITNLYDIHTFMLKNLPLPTNRLIKNDLYVNASVRKFVTNAKLVFYNNLEVGLSSNNASAIYPIFYQNIVNKNRSIFYKAAFDVFGTNIQYYIARLLYVHNYYVPLFLKYKIPYFPNTVKLLLVGFSPMQDLFGERVTVDLYYINPDYHIKLDGILKNGNINGFKDFYLPYGIEFPLDSKIHSLRNLVYKITVDEKFAKDIFSKYRRSFENKMIDEKNGIF